MEQNDLLLCIFTSVVIITIFIYWRIHTIITDDVNDL